MALMADGGDDGPDLSVFSFADSDEEVQGGVDKMTTSAAPKEGKKAKGKK